MSTPNSGFEATALTASLTVKDINASLAWYTDVMGFAVERRIDRDGKLQAVALRAGSIMFYIGQDDGAKGWTRVKGEGFSLQFATAESVDEVARKIKAAGGTLVLEPTDMPWGARLLRVLDPDGYKLSVASS